MTTWDVCPNFHGCLEYWLVVKACWSRPRMNVATSKTQLETQRGSNTLCSDGFLLPMTLHVSGCHTGFSILEPRISPHSHGLSSFSTFKWQFWVSFMYKNHLITEHLWSLERNVQHPGGMVNQSMHHVGLCWTYTLLSFSCFPLAFRSIFHSNHPMWYKPGQAARPSQFWMNLLFFLPLNQGTRVQHMNLPQTWPVGPTAQIQKT